MTIHQWLEAHTAPLDDKTIAVTGTTGGLGRELCRHLASLGANLILVDRNETRSTAFRDELKCAYPECAVDCVTCNLEDMTSVKAAVDTLKTLPIEVFIHNAGAYSIPRRICETGYDNVFQINFVSPYYMIRQLLPHLAERNGHVIAVGSIAHNYSKVDPQSIDFADRKAASKVYGNAKRFLMYALIALFERQHDVTLSIVHPGITLTGITAHYPKVIFALIKYPMRVLFMRPKKACLAMVKGVFEPCDGNQWIGPGVFDVWGFPTKKALRTASLEERRFIHETAQAIYSRMDC